MTWTPIHGKLAIYNAGCRCVECKAKKRAYTQRPEVKAKKRAYTQRPEVKAKQRAYTQRVMALAKLAEAHGLTLPDEKVDATS